MSDRERSFLLENTFYQLQFKLYDNDWLFTSLQGFFRNVLSGGSTLCFEAMHTDQFKSTFPNINVKDFYNYNIIKAYLGLIKRDLERLHKQSALYDKRKTLSHAYRGYVFAREIFEGRKLRLRVDEYDEAIQKNFATIRDMNREWAEGDDEVADFIYAKAMEMREGATQEMQAGTLSRYMDPVKQRDLDNYLFDFQRSQAARITGELDLQVVREVLEFGVKY